MKTVMLKIRTLAISLIICSCAQNNGSRVQAQNTTPEDTTTRQVTLLFAGDLMQHDGQIKAARTADGYDYTDVFARVKPEISRYDIAVANFEVMLTSNNHSCDTRAKGLERTIVMMDSLKMPHLGTYRHQKEREQNYPFIIERNGIRIAMLNFTYGTNGIPVPPPYIVNLEDTAQMAKDITAAKKKDADVIIAFPHWGIEYASLPSNAQRKLTQWMLNKGVDHVIGGHPHVVQPFEVSEDNKGNKHLTVYSLGNYVSNMTKPHTDGGAMVTMTLTKKNGKTAMTDCDYSLFWVSRPQTSGRKNFRIYPAGWTTDEMNAAERSLRERYLSLTRTLFEKHNKGIKEKLVTE